MKALIVHNLASTLRLRFSIPKSNASCAPEPSGLVQSTGRRESRTCRSRKAGACGSCASPSDYQKTLAACYRETPKIEETERETIPSAPKNYSRYETL